MLIRFKVGGVSERLKEDFEVVSFIFIERLYLARF